ncbi:MAG: MerR family DNA-binding transcriptional regulator, partial [Cyanobacteria bacterium P01_H01_bin.105]
MAIRLRIGEVAKQTGLAVGALRYYENLGLLTSV